MSDRWAACLPLGRSDEALRLWMEPGVEVCAVGDQLWLRGPRASDALDRQLRAMLGSERYAAGDDDLIAPPACTLPVDDLPAGPWRPLAEWFRVTAPQRRFSGRGAQHVALRLEPSDHIRASNLLLVPLAAWAEYTERAPSIRLDKWSFAVSDDGQALVRGAPQPPLPGRHFIETDGIAVPAGWTWSPPLDAAVLRRAFDPGEGDVVLLAPDGSQETIPGDEFVQATRSAVRLSARAAAC